MTTPTSSLRTVVMMAAAVSSAFAWMPTTRLHLPARAPACSRAVPFVMSADRDDFSAEFQVRDAEGWAKPNSATCAGTDRCHRACHASQNLISSRSGALLGQADELLRSRGIRECFVLIFNAGMPDEGVYTLQGRETSLDTYVLGFELKDEADRFATLLEAQGFGMPDALLWPTEQVSDFCQVAEFGLSFVPQNTLFMPPAHNYYDVDAFNALQDDQLELQETSSDPESERRLRASIAEEDHRLTELRLRLERLFEM